LTTPKSPRSFRILSVFISMRDSVELQTIWIAFLRPARPLVDLDHGRAIIAGPDVDVGCDNARLIKWALYGKSSHCRRIAIRRLYDIRLGNGALVAGLRSYDQQDRP
jgi:hypothetical protein